MCTDTRRDMAMRMNFALELPSHGRELQLPEKRRLWL